MTEVDKAPRGLISSEVRDPNGLKLDLGQEGIGVFVGKLGADIVEACNDKFNEKHYPITMKELYEQLELVVGEDLPSRTAAYNKALELGELGVLKVEEVTGSGGKKVQISPVKDTNELLAEMIGETINRLNDELENIDQPLYVQGADN